MSRAISYDVAGYEAFCERANDPTLSPNQKAGFPDSYRAGRSADIFKDICAKLPSLNNPGSRFLEIGSGCGELGQHIADYCNQTRILHTVIDSPQVLRHLSDHANLTKIAGPFPHCLHSLAHPLGKFDAILVYSVLQYVFVEGSIFSFVDAAIELLDRTGALLIGDIPNATMRKRFLASASGKLYHQQHYPNSPEPLVEFNVPELERIDDAVVLGLVARARAAGLQAFVVPQGPGLPMANRREDILIQRP